VYNIQKNILSTHKGSKAPIRPLRPLTKNVFSQNTNEKNKPKRIRRKNSSQKIKVKKLVPKFAESTIYDSSYKYQNKEASGLVINENKTAIFNSMENQIFENFKNLKKNQKLRRKNLSKKNNFLKFA
jgi:hypothetical protein